MKTFADLNHSDEAGWALFSDEYAFPRDYSEIKGDELWPVYDAVSETTHSQRKIPTSKDQHHGLFRHFGCLDAFLP